MERGTLNRKDAKCAKEDLSKESMDWKSSQKGHFEGFVF
jgi:hypothetical protein